MNGIFLSDTNNYQYIMIDFNVNMSKELKKLDTNNFN